MHHELRSGVEATNHRWHQDAVCRVSRVNPIGKARAKSGCRLTLTTQVGDLALQIPKLRFGSFLPSILEPRRRVDQALYAVIMEAYIGGVSTRLPGRRPACRRH